MKIDKFEGLVAAPFTPLDDRGNLAPEKVPDLANHLKENQVLGAFIIGSTGEGVSLTLSEKKEMIQTWKQEEEPGFRVMALVASNCLKEACELAEFIQTTGLYGLAVLPPYYFKPSSVGHLVDYFRDIAAAAPGLPVYYYHIPALTGVNFPMLRFLQQAGDIPNLAGIKYTAQDLMDFRNCIAYAGERYDILWGIDEILISAMAMGARGGVGSTYNYAAPLYHKMMDAFLKGDLDRAQILQSKSIEIVDILSRHGGIPAGKYFMKHIGLDCGTFRKPLHTSIDTLQFKADLTRINFDQYASGTLQMQ